MTRQFFKTKKPDYFTFGRLYTMEQSQKDTDNRSFKHLVAKKSVIAFSQWEGCFLLHIYNACNQEEKHQIFDCSDYFIYNQLLYLLCSMKSGF